MRYRFPIQKIILAVSTVLTFGCTKIKSTDIGADLLPAIDNITTFDTTFEVVASTFLTSDSMLPKLGRDINGNVGQFILGHISNDPQFGKTTASIFFEVKPDSYPFAFETVRDSLVFDSVVLCLRWTNTFGDTNAIQQVNVHRITELLKADTVYNTGKSVRYGELLGSKTFSPSELNDSLYLFKQNIDRQLRVRLNSNFGRSLLSFDTSASSPFNNDSLYRDFLKGFALIPQTAGTQANALMSFAMSDTATYLRLYYKFKKDGKTDTTHKDFTFNTLYGGAGINNIARSYNGSEASLHIGLRPRGDSLLYIQADPGTYSLLKFPGIDEFKQKKGNVIVHLAEISMQEVPTPGRRPNIFTTPEYLYLEMFDSSSRKLLPFLSDGFLNGKFESYLFGGQRRYIADRNNNFVSAYKMNITRYLQGIVTRNNPNLQLKLFAPFSLRYEDLFITFALNNLSRGNIVLGGGNHASDKIKLRVVYSKL